MSAPEVKTPGPLGGGDRAGKCNEPSDCANSHAAARKQKATVQARAALAGMALYELSSGRWLLAYPARGSIGHVREFENLDAVDVAIVRFEEARPDDRTTVAVHGSPA